MNYGDVVKIEVKGQVVNALVARSVEIAPHNPADGQPVKDKKAEEHVDLVYLDPEAGDQKGGPFVKVRELRHVAAKKLSAFSSQLSAEADEAENEEAENEGQERGGIGSSGVVAALVLLLVAMFAPFAQAQQPTVAWARAVDYAVSNLPSQQPNTYTWNLGAAPGPGSCIASPLNGQSPFFVFGNGTTSYPQFIRDATASLNEIVTPSATNVSGSSCGFTASPANQHTTFWVSSGTAGLYEAIGSNTKSPLTVILDPAWYKAVAGLAGGNATVAASWQPAQMIAGATCSAGVSLLDVTTSPWTQYFCNVGTSKFYVGTLGSKASVAAGTGAGTGPTIALSVGSNVGHGVITLTTGTTPTASAAVFTLTFTAPNSGGWTETPVCTVTSIGSPAYTSGTLTYTAGSTSTAATAVLTASATALTASTSGYAWAYTCN